MDLTDPLDDARRRAQRAEYIGRVNRVIDHIESDLAGDLSLERLAEVAAFSPYHFHRVFKAVVGENLSSFIRRRRVEKAAWMLLFHPNRPVTQIALECGFSSPAAFAKVFRETFAMSASEWRRSGSLECSKRRKEERNHGQTGDKPGEASLVTIRTIDPVSRNQTWRFTMATGDAKVEVVDLEEMEVAYVRHIGPYAGDTSLFDRLFGQLFAWAGPRGLLGPETKVLSIYDDNPEVTDETNLRVDVAMSIPPGTATDGAIGTRTIPAGRYAVGHFEIEPDKYSTIWDMMIGQWLPESGYQFDDGPTFELYLSGPDDCPDGKHVVDLYIPVKPL